MGARRTSAEGKAATRSLEHHQKRVVRSERYDASRQANWTVGNEAVILLGRKGISGIRGVLAHGG